MTLAQKLRHKRADVRRSARKQTEMNERLREELATARKKHRPAWWVEPGKRAA